MSYFSVIEKKQNSISQFRFCATRCVENQPVAERAIQIWNSFKAVIKYWEGLCKSKRPSDKSYESLVQHYKDPLIPSKLQFFAVIASIFKPFLTTFQTDRPIVPFLFNELEKIVNLHLRLIFKKDALNKANTIVKKMSLKWLSDSKNHLEDGLVDVDAATKDILDRTQVSNEKKRSFKRDCKSLVLNVLLKLQERSPLKYCVLRNSSALCPRNMVRLSEESSFRFRTLVDKLYNLSKITVSTADNAKVQYDELLKAVKFEHKERFLKFNFSNDRLDEFLGIYLNSESQYKDLWLICKLVFVLSHGQSNIERGFSVNKEVIQHNQQERSLISQRLIYDSVQSSGIALHEFEVTPEPRRSCRLASHRYIQELENTKQEKESTTQELKRKNLSRN